MLGALLVAFAAACARAQQPLNASDSLASKPNFVYFLLDDFGLQLGDDRIAERRHVSKGQGRACSLVLDTVERHIERDVAKSGRGRHKAR